MTPKFRAALTAHAVPENIIAALEQAMAVPFKNAAAAAYVRGMEQSLQIYKVEGVKHQVMYLLGNAREWQGEAARAAKKLLNKWSSQ